jgi:nucleoside phosphorylase
MQSSADVLLVTVTRVESRAVIDVFQAATGHAPQPVPIGDRIYHNLGVVNGTRVFMVQSEIGASGLGASQQTVHKGIEALSPAAVIMVGIAFGVNAAKQAIGDILVSQLLMLYDLQRVGTPTIIPRGDRAHASPWLFNRFQSAELYWDALNAKARFGLILSGEKLVDNVDFRQQLLQFEPEAIGGEMEGAGLYVACQDAKVDWILVKAICDWADGHKDEDRDQRQQTAAHNAARFVFHVLQFVPLRPEHKPLVSPEYSTVSIGGNGPGKAAHSTLPHQPYFFGRGQELETIADAIAPEARTWGALIDGPGGIGKTALAIRAGHLAPAAHFPLKIFLSAKVRELTPAGE